MTGSDSHHPEPPDAFSLWLNLWPAFHLVGGALFVGLAVSGCVARIVVALIWIYLLPPFISRLLIDIFGKPDGRFSMAERPYRVWWALTQLQMLFNRLPVLEEALRLIPGLYPAWIFLWGGRLSARAYVGPGVIIMDRYSVSVGPRAVLGFNSVLAGHMAERDAAGCWSVVAAPCVVEADAALGGGSVLGPGGRVRQGAMLPAGRRLGPGRVWPAEAAS